MSISTKNYNPKNISELKSMNKIPNSIYYRGNLELLNRTKIAIVGSRRPIAYTKKLTFELALALSKKNVCIISGAAMGVDAIAHKGAGHSNTIAVMANGLDIKYPAVNKNLIHDIEKSGLTLSLYEDNVKARPWSFVVRNEVVVALSDILIVTQADMNSGTMRSVEFAIKMNKPIYVLCHRMGDSEGSNSLLQSGLAKAILNVNDFINEVLSNNDSMPNVENDSILEYFKHNPSYEEGVKKYSQEIFMYELEGKISINSGLITVL
jgi:DNA processing protein